MISLIVYDYFFDIPSAQQKLFYGDKLRLLFWLLLLLVDVVANNNNNNDNDSINMYDYV